MLKEEDYVQQATPTKQPSNEFINGSPLKHRSKIEYNEGTIKKKNNLNDILQNAKKQYKNDKERLKNKANLSTSVDYADHRGGL